MPVSIWPINLRGGKSWHCGNLLLDRPQLVGEGIYVTEAELFLLIRYSAQTDKWNFPTGKSLGLLIGEVFRY